MPRVLAVTWFPWSVAGSPLRRMLVDAIDRPRRWVMVMLVRLSASGGPLRRVILVSQRGLVVGCLLCLRSLLNALGALASAGGSISCSGVIEHPRWPRWRYRPSEYWLPVRSSFLRRRWWCSLWLVAPRFSSRPDPSPLLLLLQSSGWPDPCHPILPLSPAPPPPRLSPRSLPPFSATSLSCGGCGLHLANHHLVVGPGVIGNVEGGSVPDYFVSRRSP